jgi:response regulator RpfG family c-di-GMP phosphodiesterase
MSRQIDTSKANRLLIVDDEPINIQILSSILGDDYTLNVATNGKKALELARSQSPDLILLDMIMPEMDGVEVCQTLQADEKTKDIPVIFVTGMSDPASEERGLDAGAVDYISKPVSPPIVKARVKIHIQNFLTLKFLEGLLSDRDMSMEDAKSQAESLLVFI